VIENSWRNDVDAITFSFEIVDSHQKDAAMNHFSTSGSFSGHEANDCRSCVGLDGAGLHRADR
jgi:hypothetical protein